MLPRVLRFSVGERRWTVPLHLVREVLEAPKLVRVPRSRKQVAGVVLRGGVVVPVYDLLPPGNAAPAHVVVLEWAELLNGIRVSNPEAQQALGEEEGGEAGPPCRGRLKFQDGGAERVDLAALYRLLEIPT